MNLKSLLKNGCVVEFNNGTFAVFLKDYCGDDVFDIFEYGCVRLGVYTDELLDIHNKDFNVKKIYISNKKYIAPWNFKENFEDFRIIWKREPKKMTMKQICEAFGEEIEKVV